ncbi:LCP family protein [Caldibacillus lycopersici]|uniref:LCP family protein n=1 Tax=Perspicuibacillus lycopersici TaxID=1325689 RepID=A0AAE3IT89_9BACI|nr:LCP family protein [Perspicuibacillus lycopersici]MCU9613041.1 LCP family protein [Perspicuibacillus lycopersici]
MRAEKKKKKRSKWKIIGFSVLAFFVILIGVGVAAYFQLKPENHFKEVPVLSADPVDTDNDGKTDDTVKLDDPIFNVLLIGSDQRKGKNIGHSDSMMVVSVNLKNYEYHIMSIPRDTRVYLDGYGYTKLTSVQYILQANNGSKEGIEGAVKAISQFTGIPINYYVETNYWGLEGIVDTLGGIEMNVPFDVTLTHPWYPENSGKVITAGSYNFDGKMVTELVHERYSLDNGEYGRQELQSEALKGIAKEALKTSNLPKLPELVKAVPDFIVETNMKQADMLSFAFAVKNFDPSKQVHYHQLIGKGQTLYDDILQANNSQIVIDEDEMQKIVDEYFIHN